MALAQVQAALAKLVTHTDIRADFLRDPLGTARALGLDEADAATLALMAPRSLTRFAGSLTAKRRMDVQKWLPLTTRALGDAFVPRLREALVEPPPGTAEDALALVDRLLHDSRDAPPWIVDLARYEAAFVEAWRPGFVFRCRRFDYPVLALAAALRRGARPDPSPRRRCVAIWLRASRGARLWHRVWGGY
jgi:hypothetical protein